MKLVMKVLPHYFEAIQKGAKLTEYRQIETVVLINSKTGEEMEFEFAGISQVTGILKSAIFRDYPDVRWDKSKPLWAISLLGKRLR